jgi:hypothetical protein
VKNGHCLGPNGLFICVMMFFRLAKSLNIIYSNMYTTSRRLARCRKYTSSCIINTKIPPQKKTNERENVSAEEGRRTRRRARTQIKTPLSKTTFKEE